jgi:hypothetical protein
VLCACELKKGKILMCFVYVTGGWAKVMFYVFVTWGTTEEICVICMLHEEGHK